MLMDVVSSCRELPRVGLQEAIEMNWDWLRWPNQSSYKCLASSPSSSSPSPWPSPSSSPNLEHHRHREHHHRHREHHQHRYLDRSDVIKCNRLDCAGLRHSKVTEWIVLDWAIQRWQNWIETFLPPAYGRNALICNRSINEMHFSAPSRRTKCTYLQPVCGRNPLFCFQATDEMHFSATGLWTKCTFPPPACGRNALMCNRS